jgi:hypothetical protein
MDAIQEGRKVLSPHGAARKTYTDGTVQLDTSIMSKAENKYAELIEARIHRQQKEDDSRCPPDRARSPQGILHQVPERRRSHLAGRRSPKWQSGGPVSQEGEPQSKTISGKIITGASETMLTSPNGFVMNLVQWT